MRGAERIGTERDGTGQDIQELKGTGTGTGTETVTGTGTGMDRQSGRISS